jgi:hypothetical protein
VTNDGITCTATNVNYNGYTTNSSAGFFVVQVINYNTVSSNSVPISVNTNALDNLYPTMNLGAGDGVFSDSPAIGGFSTNLVQVSKSEGFRTVVMFLPDEPQAIPVPIKEIDWNWSGNAIVTNSHWILTSSNATVSIENQNTYLYPTWTNLVLNH